MLDTLWCRALRAGDLLMASERSCVMTDLESKIHKTERSIDGGTIEKPKLGLTGVEPGEDGGQLVGQLAIRSDGSGGGGEKIEPKVGLSGVEPGELEARPPTRSQETSNTGEKTEPKVAGLTGIER